MEKVVIYIIYLGVLFCNTKEFNYKVYSLFNIPVADVEMSIKDTIIENQYSQSIDIKCKTIYIANYLYRIDNQYKVAIDSNFNILYFEKQINQPNIETNIHTVNNKLKTIYNKTDIEIPKNTFNIFSLIYYLSIADPKQVHHTVINNQIEKDGLIYLFEIQKELKNNICNYNIIIDKQKDKQRGMINADIFSWGVFKENAIREISVDYKKKTINKCYFQYGLASFTAYLQ